MGDAIHKIIIATTNINLYDVVGFVVRGDTLVVYTVSETLYFNAPLDLPDVDAALAELTEKFDALQVVVEEQAQAQLDANKKTAEGPPVEEPETPEDPGPGDDNGED